MFLRPNRHCRRGVVLGNQASAEQLVRAGDINVVFFDGDVGTGLISYTTEKGRTDKLQTTEQCPIFQQLDVPANSASGSSTFRFSGACNPLRKCREPVTKIHSDHTPKAKMLRPSYSRDVARWPVCRPFVCRNGFINRDSRVLNCCRISPVPDFRCRGPDSSTKGISIRSSPL